MVLCGLQLSSYALVIWLSRRQVTAVLSVALAAAIRVYNIHDSQCTQLYRGRPTP